jgi:hypothetical protein
MVLQMPSLLIFLKLFEIQLLQLNSSKTMLLYHVLSMHSFNYSFLLQNEIMATLYPSTSAVFDYMPFELINYLMSVVT